MLFLAVLALLVAFPLFNLGGNVPGSGVGQPLYETSGRPTLLVTNIKPLEVSGSGFKAGERVQVRAQGRRTSVTAGGRGRFVARLRSTGPCPGGVIVAVGSKGSRASVALSQLLCIER